MRSISVYTEEIDDLESAAKDLADKISNGLELCKNTCAIMFCDIEADEQEFISEFKKYYDFPILGATSVAMLSSDVGYADIGISLLVLTADDCEFNVGITEEINFDNAEVCIRNEYDRLKSLSKYEEEKLIVTYAPVMNDFVGDDIVKCFNSISQAPLFGGMASDGFTIKDNRVFLNGESSQNRVVMLLISGNIRPVFQHEYTIINTKDVMHTVTKSDRNIVYEMEGEKFLDVLARTGVNINEEDAYLSFIGTVFETMVDVGNNEKISVMRDLNTLNIEEKSGTFLGNVAVGSKMRLCLLNKDDIYNSVKRSFVDVVEQMNAIKDYEYSTFLVSSCAGRFLLLSTEPDAETKAYADMLPKTIALAGFYSYGEICPTYIGPDSRFNVFHNKTFTMVAF